MNVGLEVINNDGKFQITENYYNLMFKEKIEVSVPPNYSNRSLSVAHSGSVNCLVVTHSDIVYAAIHPKETLGPYHIANYAVSNPTSQTQKFTVVVFDTPDSIIDTGYGLQVFDKNGVLSYTAAEPARLTFSTMPSGKVGFYPISYAWDFKTSSQTYIKIHAPRVYNGVLQTVRTECGYLVTVSGGSLEMDGGSNRFNYVDLNNII